MIGERLAAASAEAAQRCTSTTPPTISAAPRARTAHGVDGEADPADSDRAQRRHHLPGDEGRHEARGRAQREGRGTTIVRPRCRRRPAVPPTQCHQSPVSTRADRQRGAQRGHQRGQPTVPTTKETRAATSGCPSGAGAGDCTPGRAAGPSEQRRPRGTTSGRRRSCALRARVQAGSAGAVLALDPLDQVGDVLRREADVLQHRLGARPAEVLAPRLEDQLEGVRRRRAPAAGAGPSRSHRRTGAARARATRTSVSLQRCSDGCQNRATRIAAGGALSPRGHRARHDDDEMHAAGPTRRSRGRLLGGLQLEHRLGRLERRPLAGPRLPLVVRRAPARRALTAPPAPRPGASARPSPRLDASGRASLVVLSTPTTAVVDARIEVEEGAEAGLLAGVPHDGRGAAAVEVEREAERLVEAAAGRERHDRPPHLLERRVAQDAVVARARPPNPRRSACVRKAT